MIARSDLCSLARHQSHAMMISNINTKISKNNFLEINIKITLSAIGHMSCWYRTACRVRQRSQPLGFPGICGYIYTLYSPYQPSLVVLGMSSKLGRLLLVESRTREDKIKCSSGLGFPSRCHRQHTPIKITHQSHHQHHQRHSTQKILSQPSTSCSQHTQVMAVQPKHTQALPWVGGVPCGRLCHLVKHR